MTDTNATQAKGAVHLTADDFQKTLDAAGTPVLVDFYAEWCGPCKLAAPIIDRLAEEYKGKVMIAKLDTDAAIDVARGLGIMSIPTVIMFNKKGDKMEEVDRKVGFGGEEAYRQMLDKVAPKEVTQGVTA